MPYQKTKEGRLVNEVTLGDGYPLSNDKQPLKVGGEASIINVSSPTPDGSVDGEVEVKGKLKVKDTVIQGDLKVFSNSGNQPQYHFDTPATQNCLMEIENSGNSNTTLRLRNNQGYFDLKRQYSSTSLQFTDGTNTPLTLDGANVGIGTTSPNHLLHVGDDAVATFTTNPDKAIQLSSTTDNEEVAYILYNNEGTNNIRSKYFVDDAIQWVGWDSTFSTGLNGYKWQVAGNDKMVLTTAGKLGIGTTSPDATLEVNGAVHIEGGTYVDSNETKNDAALVLEENFNIYVREGGYLRNLISKENDVITLGEAPTGYVDEIRLIPGSSGFVSIYDGDGTTETIRLHGDGKIGIGTTSPTTTLDVEGTVSYKHTAFSTAGPTDNVDVSGTTVLEVDTSSNNVVIGGFTGGVQGQILYIVKTDTANLIQLEHNEGGGSQDIFLTTGADERVVGYGGYTLYCNGTSWFSLSNPTGGADAG